MSPNNCFLVSPHACRYLVFFSPLDICYGLCHFIPVNLALWVVKELARAKKAYSGVTMAAVVYPDSLLAMAVVGMLKGVILRVGVLFFGHGSGWDAQRWGEGGGLC